MAKVSILLAEGFEEGEALTIIDILRRANIECSIISTTGNFLVTGSHNITVQADELLTKKIEDYDMVVLPGGLPGATNLRDNNEVILAIQNMAKNNKFVCAMCAAPIVLEKAGLLEEKDFTAYVGYDKKIKTTGTFKEDIVVVDKNIITSRGPATVYAFAYKLVDALGGDSLAVKNRMVYFNSFNAE